MIKIYERNFSEIHAKADAIHEILVKSGYESLDHSMLYFLNKVIYIKVPWKKEVSIYMRHTVELKEESFVSWVELNVPIMDQRFEKINKKFITSKMAIKRELPFLSEDDFDDGSMCIVFEDTNGYYRDSDIKKYIYDVSKKFPKVVKIVQQIFSQPPKQRGRF